MRNQSYSGSAYTFSAADRPVAVMAPWHLSFFSLTVPVPNNLPLKEPQSFCPCVLFFALWVLGRFGHSLCSKKGLRAECFPAVGGKVIKQVVPHCLTLLRVRYGCEYSDVTGNAWQNPAACPLNCSRALLQFLLFSNWCMQNSSNENIVLWPYELVQKRFFHCF